jgi:hypothetical protein
VAIWLPIGVLKRDVEPKRVLFASIRANGEMDVVAHPVTASFEGFQPTETHESLQETGVSFVLEEEWLTSEVEWALQLHPDWLPILPLVLPHWLARLILVWHLFLIVINLFSAYIAPRPLRITIISNGGGNSGKGRNSLNAVLNLAMKAVGLVSPQHSSLLAVKSEARATDREVVDRRSLAPLEGVRVPRRGG